MKDVTLNEDQELYVIQQEGGYSCLGFDVCEKRIKAMSAELLKRSGRFVQQEGKRGTLARYRDYKLIQDACHIWYNETSQRFDCELTPELIGLEGHLVEVITEWDETIRFQVGKSTGWMHCHLQLSRRDCTGGPAVCIGKPKYVKVVCKRPTKTKGNK